MTKEDVWKNVDSVITQLEQHFPHIVQIASFNPSRLPGDQSKITSLGNEELEVLWDLYGKGDNPDVNIDALKLEWKGLKFLMYETYHQSSMRRYL